MAKRQGEQLGEYHFEQGDTPLRQHHRWISRQAHGVVIERGTYTRPPPDRVTPRVSEPPPPHSIVRATVADITANPAGPVAGALLHGASQRAPSVAATFGHSQPDSELSPASHPYTNTCSISPASSVTAHITSTSKAESDTRSTTGPHATARAVYPLES